MKINRKELITRHNPILDRMDTDSPLTVGNGNLAYTADVTGMQTLYQEYLDTVPLCTMSQWGWHTEPVGPDRYDYTLADLDMTEYEFEGRTVTYPKRKMPGNEAVYDWLRTNPHRLNLARIGLCLDGKEIQGTMISKVHQELNLYEGMIGSSFQINGMDCHVMTACDNQGQDVLAFQIESKALARENLGVEIAFPYGSFGISASDWSCPNRHLTEITSQEPGKIHVKRTLDRNEYEVLICTNGRIFCDLESHRLKIGTAGESLELTVSFGQKAVDKGTDAATVFEHSRQGLKDFWEKGGIISLHKSLAAGAKELERRIVLSQYLMYINSSGSAPPQETGLICNSWYGKMHLEMYLWHSAWLPLWQHTDLLERSLVWYQEHLPEARENASRNGYRGARWPKMIASEGIDCPSPVAPLLVWQQPHIIYMLEMAYRQKTNNDFLERYWDLVKETADFMADFVVWNPDMKCYDILAPVIPVQECHRETETKNPAFEVEYWQITLQIAMNWGKRLNRDFDSKWQHVAEHMAEMKIQNGVYLAHELCPETYTRFNRDHPSMVGSYGLLDSHRIDRPAMERTLDKVLECWDYPSLWGWDFAMMAMTAVRLNKPELAIQILLKDTPKNCYLTNGNNMQRTRKDLPLYLPGNGSLLLAAAIMTAGYPGCAKPTPGFPDDGSWVVEFENINPFI